MKTETLRKAVFLDRDGTLNIDKAYVGDPQDFELIDGVPQALKRLKDAGYILVVVTNQSGVARGYFTMQQVHELHHYLNQLLEPYGVAVDKFYFCPHHPTEGAEPFLMDCECRKGKPGMLLKAAQELNIDLRSSFMIGDKKSDIEAGLAAGCHCFLLKTNATKISSNTYSCRDVTVVPDLSEAVSKILIY